MVISPAVIHKGKIYVGERTHGAIIKKHGLSSGNERVFILDDRRVADREFAFKHALSNRQKLPRESRKYINEAFAELHSEDMWDCLNLELAQEIADSLNARGVISVERLRSERLVPETDFQSIRRLVYAGPEYDR